MSIHLARQVVVWPAPRRAPSLAGGENNNNLAARNPLRDLNLKVELETVRRPGDEGGHEMKTVGGSRRWLAPV